MPFSRAPRPYKSRWRPVALSLLFWISPVILGFVASVLTSAMYHTAPPEHVTSLGRPRIPRDALRNRSREGLAVCINAVAGVTIDAAHAKQVVENVIEILSQGDRWLRTEYAHAPPVVDVGCSQSPSVLDRGVTISHIGDETIQVREEFRAPETLSSYRVIIFTMPDQIIERLSRGLSRPVSARDRRQAEEFICHGHVCGEVTTGVYLRPQELTDQSIVHLVLEYALGFNSTVSPPQP